MRCSASPTTSTAADPANNQTIVNQRINAMLFAQALKPLSTALGQFGDVAVDMVAQKMFAGEADER